MIISGINVILLILAAVLLGILIGLAWLRRDTHAVAWNIKLIHVTCGNEQSILKEKVGRILA